MAAAASRSHLFSQLGRRGSQSPREDDYATAMSFDPARDAINSTLQMPDNTPQQRLPQHQQHTQYDHISDHMSEAGSEGSAEMSIELGRGVKRGARDRNEDVSSNAIFQLDNDSIYEVTGTPPMRPRNSQRKTDEGLRRQASIRRATESAKINEVPKRATSLKHRSLSEALRNMQTAEEGTYMAEEAFQHTSTFNARNTRFVRSRQASAQDAALQPRVAPGFMQHTPRRAANNNATAHSNSIMLPDMPDITELISTVHKDGTQLFDRKPKSRSRFVSGSYNPARPDHYPIDSVPMPEDEKAIYASLQLLNERVQQLEMEKSEAEKRAEEYEGELIDVRSQLAVAQRRPDSALGSDEDDSAQERLKSEKKRLQASVKALQERLDRAERKDSVSAITITRLTKEQEQLVKQIGVAYYNNEELKVENETLRANIEKLQGGDEDLKDELDGLRRQNQDLQFLVSQMHASYDDETQQRERTEMALRSRLEKEAGLTKGLDSAMHRMQGTATQRSNATQTKAPSDDMAIRIAQEVQKNREKAAASHKVSHSGEPEVTSRSRSKSATRKLSGNAERPAAASRRVEDEASDADSTTQLDFTRESGNASKRASLPSPTKTKPAGAREEDSRDLTCLSLRDVNEIAKLRKKLEEERRAGRLNRAVSDPVEKEKDVAQLTSQNLPRKSSLKDVTAGLKDGTGRFSITGGRGDELTQGTKRVQVQSPHTTDESIHAERETTEAGDMSTLSNTSRRRRRAASAEGMTSAFILPDITLHSNHGRALSSKTQHNASNCTACPPTNKDVTIPTPVPVTERPDYDVDATSATIRPAQAPPLALATVMKQLEDEVAHIKVQLAAEHRLYNQHDPALSKRRRQSVRSTMNKLTAEIDKRSDQIYALYDVLEGQKEAARQSGESGQQGAAMEEREVDETLQSLGIDPAEISGRIGRAAAPSLGMDGAGDVSGEESEELPWEGLSDGESEEEMALIGRRRSGGY